MLMLHRIKPSSRGLGAGRTAQGSKTQHQGDKFLKNPHDLLSRIARNRYRQVEQIGLLFYLKNETVQRLWGRE